MIAAIALALLFAPPLDHPLRYETVETQAPAGGAVPKRFVLEQEVRFARDGDGYALTLRSTGFRSEAPLADRLSMEAAVRPTIGVPLVLRLAADGTATGVIDGVRNWNAVIAGIRATAALPGAPAGRRTAAEAVAAFTPERRDAQLLAAADDIVPRTPEGDAHRHAVTDRPQAGGAVLRTIEDIDVSPESGIVVRRRQQRTLLPATGAPISFGDTDTRLVGY